MKPRKCLACKMFAPCNCPEPKFRKAPKLTTDELAKIDRWNKMLAALE